MHLTQITQAEYGKSLGDCTVDEVFRTLVRYTCTLAAENGIPVRRKRNYTIFPPNS